VEVSSASFLSDLEVRNRVELWEERVSLPLSREQRKEGTHLAHRRHSGTESDSDHEDVRPSELLDEKR
jgi:hypothetical protein